MNYLEVAILEAEAADVPLNKNAVITMWCDFLNLYFAWDVFNNFINIDAIDRIKISNNQLGS